MRIDELAAQIDSRLQQLDQQLDTLAQRKAQASRDGASEAGLAELNREQAALQQLRNKLVKSHQLAQRAHQLERETNTQVREQRRQRQRWLGLSLCIVSGVMLLVSSYLLLQSLA